MAFLWYHNKEGAVTGCRGHRLVLISYAKITKRQTSSFRQIPWSPREQKNWNTLSTVIFRCTALFIIYGGSRSWLAAWVSDSHASAPAPAPSHVQVCIPRPGQKAPPGNREPQNRALPFPEPSPGLCSRSSSVKSVETFLGWSSLGSSVPVTLNNSSLFLGRLSKVQIASGAETSRVSLCDCMGLLGLTYAGVAPCELLSCPTHSHAWLRKPCRGSFLCLPNVLFCLSFFFFFLKPDCLLFLMTESMLWELQK